MAKIFVIKCGSLDLHSIENPTISDSNKSENNVALDAQNNTEDKTVSVYELLSSEYEQRNSNESFSVSKKFKKTN